MTSQSELKLIGVSISESPDLARLGYGEEHLHELMIGVARTVLRLVDGAYCTGLAYGGDLRPGGFTWTLYDLARGESDDSAACRRDDGTPRHRLYSYMAWPSYLTLAKSEEAELINVCHFVRIEPADAGLPKFSPKRSPDDLASDERAFVTARCLTRMRELMTAGGTPLMDGSEASPLAARIILGGKLSGYNAIMPGLFEEFLIAEEQGVPLYVLGGFGGAAGALADAMLAPVQSALPKQLSLDWHKCETTKLATLVDQYAAHTKIEQPAPIYERLADAVRRFGDALAAEAHAPLSNGLTPGENRTLMRSEDEGEIRRLLAVGLGRAFAPSAADKGRQGRAQ